MQRGILDQFDPLVVDIFVACFNHLLILCLWIYRHSHEHFMLPSTTGRCFFEIQMQYGIFLVSHFMDLFLHPLSYIHLLRDDVIN